MAKSGRNRQRQAQSGSNRQRKAQSGSNRQRKAQSGSNRQRQAQSGSTRQRQAQAKIAALRAEEASRRRRRAWLLGASGSVVLIIAVVALALALAGRSSPGQGALRLTPLSSLGKLRPAPPPGPVGPEAVPIPQAALLAGTSAATAGQPVGGIKCQASEQLVFHIHAHLTIFVNGSARQVPAAVGIPGARAASTAQGPIVTTGTCFYWLHTHAADGIIHIESPVHRGYTLGNFFDEWGQPLSQHQAGPAAGRVVAIYNGQRYVGNPRDIPLQAHAQIQLEVGSPLVAPETIIWPSGL